MTDSSTPQQPAQPGTTARPSALGTVTLADVVAYGGVAGDQNPLHYDADYAKAAGYDRLFSMGALHGSWLLSHAAELAGAEAFSRPFTVNLTYKGLAYLGEPLTSVDEIADGAITSTLSAGETVAAIGTFSTELPDPPAGPAPDDDVQKARIPVELGSVLRFAPAVHWPHPVGPGLPVPATWPVSVLFWLERTNPIERVGFDQPRTLAGGTRITVYGAPILPGDELQVVEYCGNRKSKESKRGTMEFADLITEFHDESGLRATYTNTFIQLPPAPAAHDGEKAEPAEAQSDPAAFRLRGSRDSQRNEVYYPVRQYSVDGHLRELEEVDLSTTGVLYAFTTFAGQDYGQVDLPEGTRIQTKLGDGPHEIDATYTLKTEDGEDWWFDRA